MRVRSFLADLHRRSSVAWRRSILVLAGAALVPVGLAGWLLTNSPESVSAVTCTASWDVDVSGDWSQGSNWDTGTVPGLMDDVCIDRPAADVTVTIDIPADVNSLTATESIVLPAASSLDLAATSEISGDFTASGPLAVADLTLSGTTEWLGGGWSGAVVNTNTINMAADVTLSGSLLNDIGARFEHGAATVS
ncbi:MAG: hypothetical protein QNJ12_15290, partial [Ilumatobacter sp.]|uniref:hypothetical protein n=1 Tax=Ilumatobacter sp. TaxID=1967498 RepID=UPI00261B6495